MPMKPPGAYLPDVPHEAETVKSGPSPWSGSSVPLATGNPGDVLTKGAGPLFDWHAPAAPVISGDLSMTGHKITNLADPTAGSSDAATADYAEDLVEAETTRAQNAEAALVPLTSLNGGTTGQVLTKNSNANQDFSWLDDTESLGLNRQPAGDITIPNHFSLVAVDYYTPAGALILQGDAALRIL